MAKKGNVFDGALYDTLLAPIVTEKSTSALEDCKFVFRVRLDADKPSIKRSVEDVFGVNVVSVHTIKVKGKVKRFRGLEGRRSDYKKAIVTLKQGEYIDFSIKV